MVNERYDNSSEGQDEGEYHFSDDQDNYELESTKESTGTSAIVAEKETVLTRLKSRKMLIGMIIFIMLVVIVYQMLKPNSSVPITEFSNASTSTTSRTTTTQALPTSAETRAVPSVAPMGATESEQPAQSISAPSTLAMMGSMQQQNVPPSVQTQAGPGPALASPTQETPNLSQSTMAQQPSTGMSHPTPELPASTLPVVQQSSPSVPPSVQQPMGEENSQNTAARLAVLEQQVSAISAMLQAQQTKQGQTNTVQQAELQDKVQELNTRVSNMEVAFHQLMRMLRTTHQQAAQGSNAAVLSERNAMPLPSARPLQPRMSYTVQAIIPGRAWLKSDSGDTVTVAEGDTLKGYGRITKIDPYDGIVSIDTGNKIMTLSYGSGGD